MKDMFVLIIHFRFHFVKSAAFGGPYLPHYKSFLHETYWNSLALKSSFSGKIFNFF